MGLGSSSPGGTSGGQSNQGNNSSQGGNGGGGQQGDRRLGGNATRKPKPKKIKTIQTHFVEGHEAKFGSIGVGATKSAIDTQQAVWDKEFAQRLKIIGIKDPDSGEDNIESQRETARRRRRVVGGNRQANQTLGSPETSLG